MHSEPGRGGAALSSHGQETRMSTIPLTFQELYTELTRQDLQG